MEQLKDAIRALVPPDHEYGPRWENLLSNGFGTFIKLLPKFMQTCNGCSCHLWNSVNTHTYCNPTTVTLPLDMMDRKVKEETKYLKLIADMEKTGNSNRNISFIQNQIMVQKKELDVHLKCLGKERRDLAEALCETKKKQKTVLAIVDRLKKVDVQNMDSYCAEVKQIEVAIRKVTSDLRALQQTVDLQTKRIEEEAKSVKKEKPTKSDIRSFSLSTSGGTWLDSLSRKFI